MSQENASSVYTLSPMAEHPEHGSSEGIAAGVSEADMGSYGGKIVISRSASMSPRTLAQRQQVRQHQYGSSGSDLRSLGGLSEVPDFAGDGGGSWGGPRPSRTTSGYSGFSEARLTSASTLTSFNEESAAGSPAAGAPGVCCVENVRGGSVCRRGEGVAADASGFGLQYVPAVPNLAPRYRYSRVMAAVCLCLITALEAAGNRWGGRWIFSMCTYASLIASLPETFAERLTLFFLSQCRTLPA